jgi:hypothetical protein
MDDLRNSLVDALVHISGFLERLRTVVVFVELPVSKLSVHAM